VARRVSSPILVGRDRELAALLAAIKGGGVVVVAGDAGIGKTRLIDETARRLPAAGYLVAVGGCVQLGEVSVPYAPLTEALAAIRREVGTGAFADAAAADVIGLLDGKAMDASSSSAGLFGHLLQLFTGLSAQRRLVMVFEDMHWADASTRDLVAFLARTLTDAKTSLVLTYRADEVHRRHPLRALLSELERAPAVERVDLTGLPQADVAGLLAVIAPGAGADPDAVEVLLERTGGNPFFVEELAAAGLSQLPVSLAEVILGRVARLSDSAQDVLREAAVLGCDVDDDLLAGVSSHSPADVAAALREAVADQLLAVDAAGCRFRHALVQEALYDDLLPGAREAVHSRAAEVLEKSDRYTEHVRWALLAHHWTAARQPVKAFVAAAQAGQAAERVSAVAVAAVQYERALALWDRVPDAEELLGINRAQLLATTAEALSDGKHAARAPALMRAAVNALDLDATPEHRARMLQLLGRTEWNHDHDAEARTAFRRAMALIQDRPPSRVQSLVLAMYASAVLVPERPAEAEPVLRRAVDVAAAVGDPDAVAYTKCISGATLAELGHADEAITVGREALELGLKHCPPRDVVLQYVNLCYSLWLASRLDEAIEIGRRGVAYSTSVGLLHGYGQGAVGNLIAALVAAGGWDEAARLGEARRTSPDFVYRDLRWLALPLGRGDVQSAAPVVTSCLETTAGSPSAHGRGLALARAIQLAAATQRWEDARRSSEEFLRLIDDTHDQHVTSLGLCECARVEADRVVGGARPAPELAARIAERIARLRRDWHGLLLPVSALRIEEAEAHLARLAGHDQPATWSRISETWDQLGQPYEAAWVRVWFADAALRGDGSRDAAADALRAALGTAERLRAAPLAAHAEDLARRGRLTLTGSTTQPAALDLTPRELDVLRLLAAGKTNHEIGEQLFISDKTVSVHVTHLLRKLDATSRREAAEIAKRTGVATP